jgi:hypothetical protein
VGHFCRALCGGLDPHEDYAAQAFEMTNISSLYAMLATVVHQFFVEGTVSGTMRTAFTSVRTLLFLTCSAGEIDMMNSAENVEQAERKRHCELDNIVNVQMWQAAMKHVGSLDPAQGVDVFKFAASLRKPHQPLPAWMSDLLRKYGLVIMLKNNHHVSNASVASCVVHVSGIRCVQPC